MAEVIFNCDRCGSLVSGSCDVYFTIGYYNVSEGGAWHRFAREGEERICDYCMWADPEYKRLYAYDSEAAQWRTEQGIA